MKPILFLLALIVPSLAMSQGKNFFSFTVTSIDGEKVSLSEFKGKKVLVVNVASKCGLTPQYEDLEALYEKYKDQNFVVIGFPANNFMGQEPGTDQEIKSFCTSKFNVSFPMMSKISIKGKDIAPLYKWLTEKAENGKFDAEVQWNFQKFMIDEKGNLVDLVGPRQKPNCEKITNWIEGK